LSLWYHLTMPAHSRDQGPDASEHLPRGPISLIAHFRARFPGLSAGIVGVVGVDVSDFGYQYSHDRCVAMRTAGVHRLEIFNPA
jgi:hypothetical protein